MSGMRPSSASDLLEKVLILSVWVLFLPHPPKTRLEGKVEGEGSNQIWKLDYKFGGAGEADVRAEGAF